MPIYGYKEHVDDRPATIVAAADTVEKFTEWCDTVVDQDPETRNFEEVYTSAFLDHLTKPAYKGFKHPVRVFYHTDEAQRDAFIAEWQITELKSQPARDRHLDMLHQAKVERQEAENPELKNQTIEERLGLDKNDPWDRRSEAEIEQDREMKEKMKKAAKAGDMSGDSFGGADEQRKSRPVADPISRTDAIKDLNEAWDAVEKDLIDQGITFSPLDRPDFDGMTNENLQATLDSHNGVTRPVMDDDKMPAPKVEKTDNGEVYITDIRGSHNEDGSFDIDNILAVKQGGEVDKDVKDARTAEHEALVETKKAGKRAFSPEDFAAVLRGDGSADAVVHETGDDRMKREATSRPSLSDHAEEARKAHQEDEKRKTKEKIKQRKKEDDIKAKAERDQGIFRGADLVGDDDVEWDTLPEKLRESLEGAGLKQDTYPIKDYPYNSELAGKVLLPFDGIMTPNRVQVLGGDNINMEGTVTMGEPAVLIVSKENAAEPAHVVYGRLRKATTEETSSQTDIWLVRIR
jgi:hypothetical protein